MTMPFGKFRGFDVEDLPDDYLSWLYSLPGLRNPLRRAVETQWRMRFEPTWDPPETFAHGLDREIELLKKLIRQAIERCRSSFIPIWPVVTGAKWRGSIG